VASDDDLVRKANSTDHLLDFLHGRVTDLLLNLDPSQERVVRLGGSGAILVRGVAGSGKTAVALHRIHHLLSQGDLFKSRRVLLLTYNRSLATAAKELLVSLGGAAVSDVEVHTMHKWAMGFAGIHASRVMISHKERQRKLSEAVEAVKKTAPESALWGYPLAFWQSEIHLINRCCISSPNSRFSNCPMSASSTINCSTSVATLTIWSSYASPRCWRSCSISSAISTALLSVSLNSRTAMFPMCVSLVDPWRKELPKIAEETPIAQLIIALLSTIPDSSLMPPVSTPY
jgi:hypothetical protein